MLTRLKNIVWRTPEYTSDEVASKASWLLQEGTDKRMEECIQILDDMEIGGFLREYRENAKSCAASAMTQARDRKNIS